MSNTVIRKEKPAAPETATNGAAGHAGLMDDLERLFMEQMPPATAPAHRGAAQTAPVDDPMMAELARIVGQQTQKPAARPALPRAHDPFEAALAGDALPRHEAVDPLKAFEEELKRFDAAHRSAPTPAPVQDHAFYAPPAEAAPAVAPAPAHQPGVLPRPVDASADLYAREPLVPPMPAPHHAPLDPPLDELRGLHAHPVDDFAAVPPADAYAAEPPPALPPELSASADLPAPGRNRVALLLGSAAVIAFAGIAGAVMFKGGGKKASDAPVIAAKTQPMKEKPSDPGGVEVPGQDRQVLARKVDEPKSGASVVNRDEQPVDLNQTPKREGARVILPSPTQQGASGAVSPPPAIMMPPGAAQSGFVQPGIQAAAPAPAASETPAGAQPSAGGFEAKRVKSVKVGNDGTPAVTPPRVSAPLAAAPVIAPAAPAPVAAPPKQQERPAAPAATPKSEARPATAARPPQTTGATTPGSIRTTRAAPAASEEATGEGAPLSLRPPSGGPTRSAAAAPAATTGGGAGGFAVQLAAPGSEAEARTVVQRLKQKHSGVLGGYNPVVRSAEVGEKTVYRVRVTGLSRGDANDLCARLKSDGGSCYVAGN